MSRRGSTRQDRGIAAAALLAAAVAATAVCGTARTAAAAAEPPPPGPAEPAPAEPAPPAPRRRPPPPQIAPLGPPPPPLPPRSVPDPGTGEAPIDPRFRLAVLGRFAYRLGDAGSAVGPAAGFGIGGAVDGRYGRLGRNIDLMAGLHFAYQRFAAGERGAVIVDGMPQTFGSTRVLSETTFVLTHLVAVRLGRVRPFVSLGAGLGLGYFDSAAPELAPGSASGAHFVARAGAGCDVAIRGPFSIGVAAGYTALRGARPLVTTDGDSLPLFGDFLDISAGIVYRF